MNMNTISSYADAALSAVGLENKAFLAAAPLLTVGALSIGVRVSMGAGALVCKGASKLADLAGKQDFSASLNGFGDKLVNGAKSGFKNELKAAVVLTGLSAIALGGVAISDYLTPPPPVTPPTFMENPICFLTGYKC